MSNELNQRRKSSLQTMMDIECPPAMPELDLARSNAIKISLSILLPLELLFSRLLQLFRQLSMVVVDRVSTLSKRWASRCSMPTVAVNLSDL